MVEQITAEFEIVSLTERILESSFKSKLPDFEDAIQFYCAKEAEVDFIITRNKKDFRQKEITVAKPEELLKELRVDQQ